MKFEQSPTPSPEEMAKIEKERALSDAEILKGDAEYKFSEKGKKRLEATDEQIEEAKREMDRDLESKTEQAKIEQKLNPQNVEFALKIGKPVEVKVKRTSGKVENDWIVVGIVDKGKGALVFKNVGVGKKILKKVVPLEKLKQWNITTFERKNKISPEKVNKKIPETKSFEDLVKLIDEKGGVQGKQEFFSAEKLKNIISRVRKGELDITHITRTDGLRQKVEDLIAIEKQRKNIENL